MGFLFTGRGGRSDPVVRVIAIISRDSSRQRLAEYIRFNQPKIQQSGTVIMMHSVTVIDPIDTDVVTHALLVNIAGHTQFQTFAGIAQITFIRVKN